MSKQCLDVHQMQHLQELGLELKDTMLYWIKPLDAVIGIVVGLENDWQLDFIDDKKKKYLKYIPAYTLQDVLDALPKEIKYKDFIYYLVYDKSEGFIGYYGVDFDGNNRYARYEEFYNGIDGLSVIDAAYEILVWCIDNKFVETNKNE